MQEAIKFRLFKVIDDRFIDKYSINWTRIRIKFEKEWFRVLNSLNYQQLKMRINWLDSEENTKYSFYPPIPHEFFVLNRSYMSNSYVEGYIKQTNQARLYSDKKLEEMGDSKVKNLIKVVLLYHFDREINKDLLMYSTIIIKTYKKWEKQLNNYTNIDLALAGLYEIANTVVEGREKNKRRLK